jgi:hypothetical protein
MADSPCFELTCKALESDTSLDRLEARGTVRLALKAAGLDARSVTAGQMGIVVEKLLPDELKARGVENGDRVCAALNEKVARMETTGVADAPEAVFARLGGG